MDGRTVAVGSVVVEDGWAGIHNMATATGHRRRGAARAVLHTTRSYLAVMETNEAARALYQSAGYTTAYRYWYRATRSYAGELRPGQPHC